MVEGRSHRCGDEAVRASSLVRRAGLSTARLGACQQRPNTVGRGRAFTKGCRFARPVYPYGSLRGRQ